MKLISFAIPSYNSQDYMANCIESLLPGGDEVEIIIVNDGSSDDTAKIADEYAAKYPNIVKAVHQQNGGHGEAVNSGIRNATGLYFKVVDSDDWVDSAAYTALLAKLREFRAADTMLDLFISNYVYEKEGASHKKVMKYSFLPQDTIFNWEDVGHIKLGQYILMHSVVYRTSLLRECGLELPKHTFYVDNIYVFTPLPSVSKMYYLDVDFYRYYIGREDQSVNESVMIKRIDQQIRVNKIMVDQYLKNKADNKRLKTYMYNYLEIITTVSSIMLIKSGIPENFAKKDELWQYIKESDEKLYRKLKGALLGRLLHLPGKVGRGIAIMGYKISQKMVGFN